VFFHLAVSDIVRSDAAQLVRTIMKAVQYIHDSGIVHHNLKPENLLFRTAAEGADVLIADFSLSRVMEEKFHDLHLLKEICGTMTYMAPEILKKSMWSTVLYS
jgi:calcium/calmodulin-dependent protein kinase I